MRTSEPGGMHFTALKKLYWKEEMMMSEEGG
jgi:hypothetical protein